MKRILASQAIPGMLVAQDIYTPTNQLLIPKNTLLNGKFIAKLQFHSVPFIQIHVPEPKIEMEQPYSVTIKESPEYQKFHNTFVTSVNSLKKTLVGFLRDSSVDVNINALLNGANSILAESRNGVHVFHMLNCMRDFDDLTYAHSLNVSLICNVFGKKLKFSESEIDTLTLCGLLHDIGKLLIPSEIIDKPSSLTLEEYNTIKTHPVHGYNILKNKNLDLHIIYSALMHHEKCDGTGYPNGLKNSQIDDYAKIVAIADIYDAMTSARVYRGPICPFEVINVFEKDGLQKYDTYYLLTFLESVVETYLNNQVKLSDNRVGEVIMINKQSLSRPVVRIENEFIDLAKNPNLTIVSII